MADAGYHVTLVGFKRKKSAPLSKRSFEQVRLPIFAEQGKMLYASYWFFLFFYLLFKKADVLCAIDLDTILPVYYASRIKGTKRVHDAHEIFTDLREVITRPSVYKMWHWIANHTIAKFPVGYTIGTCYAEDFKKRYGVDYKVVRNATVLRPFEIPERTDKFILYQGALNVGRCFEQLIPAMKNVDARLIVCGEGNFSAQAHALAIEHGVTDKVIFEGYVPPERLVEYTRSAYIGITLFEDTSLSNRLSLANRFFDYMHNAVPQLCIKYPEYEHVNAEYEIAVLIDDISPENIATTLNAMLNNEEHYKVMQANCMEARKVYCWQEQAKTLLSVYQNL